MMKGKKFGRSLLAFVVALAVMLTTVVSVSTVSAAATSRLKLTATGTMLREGTKVTKSKIKKCLKVTKNGKKINSFTVKQLNTVISGSKCKVTIKKGSLLKSTYIKVNRITCIYIKECSLSSLVEGSTFDPTDFTKHIVVMAGYKKGGDQKINTFEIVPATQTVTANSNGEFDVTVKFGKFKDKISIPVTTDPSTDPSAKPEQMTVTYKSLEGSVLSSTKVNAGNFLQPPKDNLSRNGKTFVGWQISNTNIIYFGKEYDSEFYDNNRNTLSSAIKSLTEKRQDVVVIAYYTDNLILTPQVAITYLSLEGSVLSSTKVNAGNFLQPPKDNLSRNGKTFIGWQISNTNIIYFGKEYDSEFYDNNRNTLSSAIKSLTATQQDVVVIAYYTDNLILTPQVAITYLSLEGSVLSSTKVNAGDSLQPPKDNLSKAGKTFAGWKLNNTIYWGKESDSEFYDNNRNTLSSAIRALTSKKQDVIVIAYYIDTPTPQPQVTVSYQSAEGPVLTSSKVNAGEDLKPPTTNLWRAEKTFSGWRVANTNVVYYGIETDSEFYDNNRNTLSSAIKSLTATQQDVNIIAFYTNNPEKYYPVSITGGNITSFDGERDSAGNFKSGAHVFIKPEIPVGKYFAGWFDDTGIVSSDENYDFHVHTKISLTAVYKDVVVEKQPVVHFTGNKYQLYPDSNGVRLFMAVEIPNGYTKNEWGFIFTGQTLSADQFILNGNRVAKVMNNGTSLASADWTYDARFAANVWEEKTTVYFRIYLNYTAPNGEQHTLYGDILPVTLSK